MENVSKDGFELWLITGLAYLTERSWTKSEKKQSYMQMKQKGRIE